MLNRVQATGGSATDLQKFYTALYRVLINPNIASDVNGQYRGFDNAIRTASHTVYQNYSGWDIYRSWASLIALIAPAEASDIAKSMVLDGQQGGLLPKWSHNHNEHFVMTGDPGPDHRDQPVRVRRPQLRHRRRADADGRAAPTAAPIAGQPDPGPAGGLRAAAVHPRGPVGLAGVLGVATSPSRSSPSALGDTAKYNTYIARAPSGGATCSTPSRSTSTTATTTAPGRGRWTRPARRGYTEGNASQYTWMVTYNFAVADQPDGRPADRDPAARPPLHPAQRRPVRCRTSTSATSPSTACRGRTTSRRHPAGTSRDGAAGDERVVHHRRGRPARQRRPRRHLGLVRLGGAGHVPAHAGRGHARPARPAVPVHPDRPARPATSRSTAPGPARAASTCRASSVNGAADPAHLAAVRRHRRRRDPAYTMGGSPSAWGTNPADVPPSFNDGWHAAAGGAGTRHEPRAEPPGHRVGAVRGQRGSGEARSTAALGTASGARRRPAPSSSRSTSARRRTSASFVVKHAGLGGETTGWNTGAFTIETSPDGDDLDDPGDRVRQPDQPHVPPDRRRCPPATSG